jgi:TPR repeat protein
MIRIRGILNEIVAKHVLFIFDSCFAGTIFTSRSGNDVPLELSPDIVERLMERPARNFITAGRADERIPAHSPLPDLFIAALRGAADRYGHGVISAADIGSYLQDQVLIRRRDMNITPQEGRLSDTAFAEGEFLFRVAAPRSFAPKSQDVREAARLLELAYNYRYGSGGQQKDEREAARLYRLAADQGNAEAQAMLGLFYEQGRGGLSKDAREAARLYRLAADQGNAWGQGYLATFYRDGLGGVTKDEREAARLYRLAADQGNAWGQSMLGLFYEQGRGGLSKDEREAARLYRLAADQGDAWAQSQLDRVGLTR